MLCCEGQDASPVVRPPPPTGGLQLQYCMLGMHHSAPRLPRTAP